MGRPRLPAAQKKSRKLRFRMTAQESGRFEELARLPKDKLALLFHLDEPPRFAKSNESNIMIWLIDFAYRKLEAARVAGEVWAQTGKSLPTRTAALHLGLDEEQFRRFAEGAGLVARKDKMGLRWSEADVDRVREYLTKVAEPSKT